ncbi:hypothetical protein SELMODRAFT_440210 [Selaginella moellendorffii]|uniref:Chitin-binding type-1 domain-containing protein n=1 Tax=Selaginella moellendorffii TaxID=88036 RepID=D8R987_SELML|nr:hypothetical protein SELMODRAFT_440210 [Selaginella moellendorffii]
MLMSPTLVLARSPLFFLPRALLAPISISIVALLLGGGARPCWATIPCSPTVQCPQNCCCGVNGYCGTGDGYCGAGNCLSQCPKSPSPPNPPPQAQAPPVPPSSSANYPPPTSWGSSGASRYAPPPPQYFYAGGSDSNIADLEYHDIHHHHYYVDNVWRIVGIACGIAALVLIAAFLIVLLARSAKRRKNACDCDGDH